MKIFIEMNLSIIIMKIMSNSQPQQHKLNKCKLIAIRQYPDIQKSSNSF